MTEVTDWLTAIGTRRELQECRVRANASCAWSTCSVWLFPSRKVS
jgi:hypothetical protein